LRKLIPGADPALILTAVARFPEGAQLEDLFGALKNKVPRRTLQRRLSQLVEGGRLSKEGRARAVRYRLPVGVVGVGAVAAGASRVEGHGEVSLRVSREAERIRSAVRAPIQNRRPVGYNRAFLDDYQPNRTQYLGEALRRHLLALGRSPDGVRPAGTYARQIINRLLIDLSWNSSRLEGNTYSLLETQRLLELGQAAPGKDARDAQMILNHKAAIELLVDQAAEVDFNRYTILNVHALLSDNLLPDPKGSGRLRAIPVAIQGTVYRPPEVPQLIEECFQHVLDTARAIADPFEQAFFAMVHLPYLQPFEDVNKRVSRLAANLPMIRENLCPLSFVDVPERDYVEGYLGVYELNRIALLRDVFAWAYERSCARHAAVRQSLGEPDPFRMRYRGTIAEVVSDAVRQVMNPESAKTLAARYARDQVPVADQPHFVEVVATEIDALHEGNIARYRIRPSEFHRWREAIRNK
jgi:Fic/DOC family